MSGTSEMSQEQKSLNEKTVTVVLEHCLEIVPFTFLYRFVTVLSLS